MTDTKPPFKLPESFHADPYGDHWSFCYATEGGERRDYDFRVEFTEGVPEPEQAAIVTLLEAAPKLLEALIAVKDAGYLEGGYQLTLDMVDAAIASATGQEG